MPSLGDQAAHIPGSFAQVEGKRLELGINAVFAMEVNRARDGASNSVANPKYCSAIRFLDFLWGHR